MKTTLNGRGIALLALAFWTLAAGCSSSSRPEGSSAQQAAPSAQRSEQAAIEKVSILKSTVPPSEADIVQAIDASGAMKRADGSFSVVPPIKVARLGKQNEAGTWPVQARFQLKIKGRDGLAETTSAFRVFLVQQGAGRQAWRAELGT